MPNNRLFYAVQSVQVAADGDQATPSYTTVQGLQSVGMNTNFNLEPVYQLGQLELYDNYEEIPEVEITLSKVLDSQPTIYEMAMGDGKLIEAANVKSAVRLSLYPDTQESASGTPVASVSCKPAYVSSVSYNFPTEGNFTEEVTIVSNDKNWSAAAPTSTSAPTTTSATNILRRGLWDKATTVLPTGDGGVPTGSKINSVKVSMNLGREQIRELGSKTPYYRYIKFPVEISTEIEVIATAGDGIGVADSSSACSDPKALSNKSIAIHLCDGMVIDLGSKNKLTSVNFTGGDTGGGNATITYSFRTYNDFTFTGAGSP